MPRPTIGITVDNKNNTAASGTYECAIAYSRCVAAAGGAPLLLPHELDAVDDYLRLCDGFIFTGGVDPRMEAFGDVMHPKARPMDPQRQAFELALFDALQREREKAVLGVCLGMQLMTLHAGGKMNQHLPDTLADPAVHEKCNRHGLNVLIDTAVLPAAAAPTATVVSAHNQAMETPGRLRILARAPDGVIEAVDDPSRPFYLGVQWHPERGGDGPFNLDLFRQLVSACR